MTLVGFLTQKTLQPMYMKNESLQTDCLTLRNFVNHECGLPQYSIGIPTTHANDSSHCAVVDFPTDEWFPQIQDASECQAGDGYSNSLAVEA